MKQIQLVGMTPEELNSSIFNYIDKKIDELKKLVTQAHHIFALVTSYGPQLLSEEFLQLLYF